MRKSSLLIVRHYCDLNDGIEVWGWTEHDGENFGRQVIVDRNLNLKIHIGFTIAKKGSQSYNVLCN